MRTIKELKDWIAVGNEIMWNDPEPVVGNDYRITFIEDLSEFIEENSTEFPILIQYNNGNSEAQIFLHEINKLI